MVDSKIIETIRSDFEFLLEIDDFKGLFLYGSLVHGDQTSRSDIDLCIVMGGEKTKSTKSTKSTMSSKVIFQEICNSIDVHGKNYDIHFFHDMPWYLRGDIIDHGVIILCGDQPALYEYLYPYRKIWDDQKSRQKLSKKELYEIL